MLVKKVCFPASMSSFPHFLYLLSFFSKALYNQVLVAQSCPTLCDAMDYSPPGSSVHGILQARILEWVAVSFSKGCSWPRDPTWDSCIGRQILYHSATWEGFSRPFIFKMALRFDTVRRLDFLFLFFFSPYFSFFYFPSFCPLRT